MKSPMKHKFFQNLVCRIWNFFYQNSQNLAENDNHIIPKCIRNIAKFNKKKRILWSAFSIKKSLILEINKDYRPQEWDRKYKNERN